MKSPAYWLRLFLFTIISFIVIAEIMIRIMIPNENYDPDLVQVNALEYRPNAIARQVIVPNQTIEARADREGTQRHTVSINSLGYNSPEFMVEKPENTIRIITLGGSAAFDANAPDGRSWAVAMGDYIEIDDPKIETINGAVSGYSTLNALAKLQNEVWVYKPDYVAVYNCWNDIKLIRGLQPTYPMLQTGNYDIYAQWKGYLRANYAGSLDRALGTSHLYLFTRAILFNPNVTSEGQLQANPFAVPLSEAIISETGLRQYELNLLTMIDFNRRIGAETVFIQQARLANASNTPEEQAVIRYDYANLTPSALANAFAQCDEVMRDVAEAEDIPYIETQEAMVQDLDHFLDHVHLLPQGSALLAQIVGEAFNAILQERLETTD